MLARRRNIGEVGEIKMFGGLCFTINGNMCCGVAKQDLMLRLGNDGAADALEEPHVRPMDFTGRPLRSMVFVAARGVAQDDALRNWVNRAVTFALTLPPKK